MEVDNLKSLVLLGSGNLEVVISSTPKLVVYTLEQDAKGWGGWKSSNTEIGKTKSYRLKFMRLIVPCGGRTYVINCLSDAENFANDRQIFDQAIASFRVLERPTFWEHITSP
jgi:hypothetical protein